ncbi:hypothetical protein FRC12_013668 [Ceratobasidium sp. 428]|nr:hypothetical protein FRC09_014713 [Ceratobasidium sp. 395]KAG8749020.1 hypothetical protein FRC12_013668 [Ceratobasidium sp. 428]
MSSEQRKATHQPAVDASRNESHPQFWSSAPRLPIEILHMIVKLSSFEGLTSLVRLNHYFRQEYNKLLYRNITIHSAYQLFKLLKSENAARNLSGTRIMSITKPVFLESSWKDIHSELKPAECLCHVLQMTSSLRELGLDFMHSGCDLVDDPQWHFEWSVRNEIRNLAVSDSSFLSRLSRLRCPSVYAMLPALAGRPMTLAIHPRDSFPTIILSHLLVAIAVVVSTESLAVLNSTSVDAVGVLKRASDWGLVVKHLKITVAGSRSEPWVPENLDWPRDWIERIAEEGGTENLISLDIMFDPPLEENVFEEQEEALARAVELIPNLRYTMVGSWDVQWRRHVRRKPNSVARLPEWTPCPSSESSGRVRRWWLKKSGLCDGVPVKEGGVPNLLVRLRNLMLTRWSTEVVPPIEWFHKRYDYPAIQALQSRIAANTS